MLTPEALASLREQVKHKPARRSATANGSNHPAAAPAASTES